MNNNFAGRILVGILLVIAGGIVVHAPVTVWLGTVWPQYAEVVKAWKELLMALSLVLLVAEAWRQGKVATLLSDKVMQLALVFAGLHFLMIAVFQNGLHTAGAGLLIDLRYVLYFVLVYGTVRLFPWYRRLFLNVFAVGVAVVLGFGLLQIFILPKDILAEIGYSKQTISPYLTVDENPDYIRINSTLRGPNPLGAYIVIVLSMAVAAALVYGKRWRDARRRWLLAATAVAGGLVLGATYSRSSVIGLLVAFVAALLVLASAKVRRQILILSAVIALIAGVSVYVARDTSFVSNVVFHDNPTTGARVDSNAGHIESLIDGTGRLLVQPLGAGVGSTGSASFIGENPVVIENQYLFIAHEAGWLGLIVFVWLFVEIMRRLYVRRKSALALGVFASGCGLAVIGLLLPVWVDDTVSVVWWGLAGLAIANGTEKRHGTRKSN